METLAALLYRTFGLYCQINDFNHVAITSTPLWAVLAGFAAVVSEVIGYYAIASVVVGVPDDFTFIYIGLGVALVGGPLFGLAGFGWRSELIRYRVTGIVMLGAVFIVEGLYHYFLLTHTAFGAGMIVTGLLITALLPRSRRDRRYAFLALPVLLLPGAAFFALVSWVTFTGYQLL